MSSPGYEDWGTRRMVEVHVAGGGWYLVPDGTVLVPKGSEQAAAEAAVVAWLRVRAKEDPEAFVAQAFDNPVFNTTAKFLGRLIEKLADAIERGEHRRDGR